MGLRDIGATLPPGFRFYPSDEELVCHYLYKKIANDEEVLKGTLVEIDLHTCEPWQLPDVAKLNSSEWYFFSFRDRKYATGFRTNRATTSGYWKATGKDRPVLNPATHEVVGMRKTLVFYRNRAPNGIKTGWIMHEFRLETPHMPPKEDWVLCRVFHKSKSSGDESSSKLQSPQYHATAGATSPVLPASTHHHHHHRLQNTLPCTGYHQQQQTIQIPSFSTPQPHQNLALLNPNLLHFSSSSSPQLEMNNATTAGNEIIISRGEGGGGGGGNNVINSDDEYGFLWDMSCSLQGDGVSSSNLGDMKFDHDTSSLVFL